MAEAAIDFDQFNSGSGKQKWRCEGSSGTRNVLSAYGVPTRCWCGSGITTYISKTTKNPNRKFYRCEIAVKRKREHHLFKWVDEAWNEEIVMEDARKSSMVHQIEGHSMATTDTHEEVEALKAEGCLGVIKFLCPNIW
ncbi:hypothetical protein N665_0974s0002 [Sinapis alba]|nr:hypothetical protein N665_0974s0002 [Sinapis alba]